MAQSTTNNNYDILHGRDWVIYFAVTPSSDPSKGAQKRIQDDKEDRRSAHSIIQFK